VYVDGLRGFFWIVLVEVASRLQEKRGSPSDGFIPNVVNWAWIDEIHARLSIQREGCARLLGFRNTRCI